MAFAQSDLDNLRACIASGVLVTKFADGREVRYQTLAELIAAEQMVSAAITAADPLAPPRRRTIGYRSGL